MHSLNAGHDKFSDDHCGYGRHCMGGHPEAMPVRNREARQEAGRSHLPIRCVDGVTQGRSIPILVNPNEFSEVRACAWKDNNLADCHRDNIGLNASDAHSILVTLTKYA